MQTFLPYPSFAESAAVLDVPRLGKQRVETLQILRAVLVPTYGWQRHPAVAMWRGHLSGLAAYGLAMTDEWIARGYGDTVRDQIVEFAPEVDRVEQAELPGGVLPAWVGDPALHESHRSRLIAKDAAFYRPLFPDTPEGLDYVWPPPAAEPPPPATDPLWVVRAAEPESWRDAGLVGMPETNPAGKVTPAWRAQLGHLAELETGATVALLGTEARLLHLGRISGPLAGVTIDGEAHVARAVDFRGDLDRADLPVPAQLQNPRLVFPVHLAP